MKMAKETVAAMVKAVAVVKVVEGLVVVPSNPAWE